MNTFISINNKFNKKKVVFIMGAIGTGKSRLSIDLATHFPRLNVFQLLLEGQIRILKNLWKTLCSRLNIILNLRVDTTVDEMVNADRLVDEVRQIFIPDADYTKGIRRSIGIQQLINERIWSVHHIIATDVLNEDRKEVVDKAWRNTVLQPCLDIVKRFLKTDDHNIIVESKMNISSTTRISPTSRKWCS
ncbi:hypothetical protein H5410_021352 [Solanum commersonii]|uniref:Uncharacterized protein n=1 Tax=Solanum commersonii TaxID=4109 RepID=A0A9J5ZDR1_SOLCO|nr:hypothetical protein H5410_021352 [Solanum commersonii]